MIREISIIIILLLFNSCIKEDDCPDLGRKTLEFEMKDVPYIFEGDEAVGFRPYYFLTNRLNIMAFKKEKLDTSATYDYEYCREHSLIPFPLNTGSYTFLLVGNLLDHQAMNYEFKKEGLEANFRILDHREPPVYLVATNSVDLYEPSMVPAELTLLVARLEIRVVNSPAWVTGFDFNVERIAGEISNMRQLRDTTSIYKTLSLNGTSSGEFWIGITTFPTYQSLPAKVDVRIKGTDRQSLFVIEDNRLHFDSGKITRVSIEFDTEDKLNVSVEVNGKWEIIDEGRIEI